MLERISDLEQVFKSTDGRVTEWLSPQGQRYRYERNRAAVGKEVGWNKQDGWHHEWYVLDKNDLTHAKRRVFELINEDEL